MSPAQKCEHEFSQRRTGHATRDIPAPHPRQRVPRIRSPPGDPITPSIARDTASRDRFPYRILGVCRAKYALCCRICTRISGGSSDVSSMTPSTFQPPSPPVSKTIDTSHNELTKSSPSSTVRASSRSCQVSPPPRQTCAQEETARLGGCLRRPRGRGHPSGTAAGRRDPAYCRLASRGPPPEASAAALANGRGSPRSRAPGRRASLGRTSRARGRRCLRSRRGRACGRTPVPSRTAGGRASWLTPGSANRSCIARFSAARRTVNSTGTGCERNAHRHSANGEHVLAQKSDRERRRREHRGSHSCAENDLGCLPCPQAAARRRAIRDLDGVDSTCLAQVSCGASPRPRKFVRMRSATGGRQSNAAEISGTFGDKRALRREKSATLTRGRC